MYESLMKVITGYGLLSGFAIIGATMWISYWLSDKLTKGRLHGSAVAILIALALALTLAWQPIAGSTSAMVVVGVLAFAMGVQNAAVLFHMIPDVATNVMTLTLVRLLSNLSIIGGDNERWRFRVASLATFFVSAMVAPAVLYCESGNDDSAPAPRSTTAAPARSAPCAPGRGTASSAPPTR